MPIHRQLCWLVCSMGSAHDALTAATALLHHNENVILLQCMCSSTWPKQDTQGADAICQGTYLGRVLLGRITAREPSVAQAVEAETQKDEAHNLVHHMPLLPHDPACAKD